MGLIKIKSNGAHVALRKMYIRQTGDWVEAQAAWTKVDGVWTQIFPTPSAVPATNTLTTTVYAGFTDTQDLTITNQGNVPMTILRQSIVSTANFSTSFDFNQLFGVTINPGESKTIPITFTGISVADESGQIEFVANVGELGEEAFFVDITASVIPTYAQVSINKKSIAFTQKIGEATASTTLVVTNTGNAALEIYRFDGDSGIQLNDVPATILPGRSATVAVNNGTYSDVGTFRSAIVLQTNSQNSPDITIPVSTTSQPGHGSFTTTYPGNYTWTVPDGVYNVRVKLAGAGGGGAGAPAAAVYDENNYYGYLRITDDVTYGADGGTGFYTDTYLSVTPGQTISYTIGDGGAGGAAQQNGSNGQQSVFNGTIIAPGGYGGGVLNSYSTGSTNGAWSSLLNSNSIWNGNGDYYWNLYFPATQDYQFNLAIDNYGTLYVDDVEIVYAPSFNSVWSATTEITQGWHTIKITGTNTGGPAAIGATITQTGTVIWTTRYPTVSGIGVVNAPVANGGAGGIDRESWFGGYVFDTYKDTAAKPGGPGSITVSW